MHTASAAVLRLYQTVNRLSRTFFRTSQLLLPFPDFASHANSCILPELRTVVKNFFLRFSGLTVTLSRRSLRRELVYSSRLFRVCQALFPGSGTFVPSLPAAPALSPSAQIIYQTLPLLSTLFYLFFLLFSFSSLRLPLHIYFTCVTLVLLGGVKDIN